MIPARARHEAPGWWLPADGKTMWLRVWTSLVACGRWENGLALLLDSATEACLAYRRRALNGEEGAAGARSMARWLLSEIGYLPRGRAPRLDAQGLDLDLTELLGVVDDEEPSQQRCRDSRNNDEGAQHAS